MNQILVRVLFSLLCCTTLRAVDIPSRIQTAVDKRESNPDDEESVKAADLLSCSISRVSEDTLDFKICVAGKIPYSFDVRNFYAVYIDLDNSAKTGNCDRHRGMDFCVYSQMEPGDKSVWKDSVILDSYFVLGKEFKVSHNLNENSSEIIVTAKSNSFRGLLDFSFFVTTGLKHGDRMPDNNALVRYFDFQGEHAVPPNGP